MTLSHISHRLNLVRRQKPSAILHRLPYWTAIKIHQSYKGLCHQLALQPAIKEPSLDNRIIGAIHEEVHEVWHNYLCPFFYQHLLKIIVCQRMIFYQYFADYTHLRLPHILMDRQCLKILDYIPDIPGKFIIAAICQLFLGQLHPLAVQ